MEFVINHKNASRLDLQKNFMGAFSERVVHGEVSLPLIDAIVVPPFAITNTRRILNQHGYGHIAVMPLADLP